MDENEVKNKINRAFEVSKEILDNYGILDNAENRIKMVEIVCSFCNNERLCKRIDLLGNEK